MLDYTEKSIRTSRCRDKKIEKGEKGVNVPYAVERQTVYMITVGRK